MTDLNSCGRSFFFLLLLATLAGLSATALAQVESARSSLTVHVYKTGLLSSLGHNHVVTAPLAESKVDASRMLVEIMVRAKDLRVIDPEDSESARAEIQATMLGSKVLDADRYPEIRFKSSRIEPAGAGRYHVTGILELHGTRKEIGFDVAGGPGRYRGNVKLNQTDFGIQPVSSLAGAVKVKNQVEIDLDVYQNPAPTARR